MPEEQAFVEDDEILQKLTDPLDVEAFRNLMENAHERGESAAEMVRENPEHTSRKAIKKLCLANKPRFLSTLFKSLFRKRSAHEDRDAYPLPPPQAGQRPR